MKVKRSMGWVIAIFIIAPIIIFTINILFFPKRDVSKQAANYINNSIDIELSVPEDIDIGMNSIYTGVKQKGITGGLKRESYNGISFFNGYYGKYFKVSFIGDKKRANYQFIVFTKLLHDKNIIAKVNKSDLDNFDYGTEENPVPIFMFNIPKYVGWKDYEDVAITEDQYKASVYYYLAYIMPEEEFKLRFGNESN